MLKNSTLPVLFFRFCGTDNSPAIFLQYTVVSAFAGLPLLQADLPPDLLPLKALAIATPTDSPGTSLIGSRDIYLENHRKWTSLLSELLLETTNKTGHFLARKNL